MRGVISFSRIDHNPTRVKASLHDADRMPTKNSPPTSRSSDMPTGTFEYVCRPEENIARKPNCRGGALDFTFAAGGYLSQGGYHYRRL